ncbi:MAG TPA: SfiI family type II restriction endonuclease [Acidobacteriota bacterium]|nr:SfiI family type II restriction endonuclease [Acidobacteriota bacterium]
MFLNPEDATATIVEDVEKASLRLAVQALIEFREEALKIFQVQTEKFEHNLQDVGEDITREALDRMGLSRIEDRLFGKIDYKRARYVFHPEYALRQALFVDSKTEKDAKTVTLQMSQTSMSVRQERRGTLIDQPGSMPKVWESGKFHYLTTIIIVKYHYEQEQRNTSLKSIIAAAIPNGLLQDRYNPSVEDTIWRAGRDAPTLGEKFRVRLRYGLLERKSPWRVQRISAHGPFSWNDATALRRE